MSWPKIYRYILLLNQLFIQSLSTFSNLVLLSADNYIDQDK